jgi:hypothetical protein
MFDGCPLWPGDPPSSLAAITFPRRFASTIDREFPFGSLSGAELLLKSQRPHADSAISTLSKGYFLPRLSCPSPA